MKRLRIILNGKGAGKPPPACRALPVWVNAPTKLQVDEVKNIEQFERCSAVI